MISLAKKYAFYFISTYFSSFFYNKKYKYLPKNISINANATCPLRCINCNYWKKEYKKSDYSLSDKKKTLIQLKKWLGSFKLRITGGEPFANSETLELIDFASKNDIITSTVTNGYLIDNDLAKKIVNSGLKSILLSLDSSNPKIHDKTRGRKNTFKKLINAISFLKKHRKNQIYPKIYINSVIMKSNSNDLVKILNLAKKLKIDGIGFQPVILDSFFLKKHKSQEDLWPDNINSLLEQIDFLVTDKIKNNFIFTPLKLLKEYKNYFQNKKTNVICKTSENNFVINEKGWVKLCHKKFIVGNIKNESPEKIWNKRFTNCAKHLTLKCCDSCKLISCNHKV